MNPGATAALAALLAAGLLAPAAMAATDAPGAIAPGVAALALKPCRLPGLEHDALCGGLQRPLDPAQPEGRKITVQVAVLPALARQKLPDPVFFFAGGPGQGAIGLAGAVDRMLGRLGARRDIVLIDQRGTGRSAPLGCDAGTAEEGMANALDRDKLLATMDLCRQRLETLAWGDLRQYTTTIAMADADAVRAALGAEHVDLVGGSYGTRAALEYLRQYPQHVRRVVIDGVAPPDMVLPSTFGRDARAAFDSLLADCAADADCARRFPQLRARWEALLASLPRQVNYTDPVSGQPRSALIGRETVFGLMRPALYVPAVGAVLPQVIADAAAGRFEGLLTVGTALGSNGALNLSEGMHFSVICAEDMPRLAEKPAGAGDDGFESLYRQVCARWPRGSVPPAFYTIPASPVPVLLLSGAIDPATPPRHAERVAAALGAQARHVVVPNVGHGVMAVPCVRDAVFRFIDTADDAKARAVDLGCAASIPRPPAFSPPLPARAASAANDPAGYPAAGLARAGSPAR